MALTCGGSEDGGESLPPLPPNKTVVRVFGDYMKYLYECAKSYIKETHGVALWSTLEFDIKYVLTHPNGWGGPQQVQMRRAAILAGLIPSTEDGHSRIEFVTEGEASLHFCRSNGLTLDGSGVRSVSVVNLSLFIDHSLGRYGYLDCRRWWWDD